jgi:hypothetical protein
MEPHHATNRNCKTSTAVCSIAARARRFNHTICCIQSRCVRIVRTGALCNEGVCPHPAHLTLLQTKSLLQSRDAMQDVARDDLQCHSSSDPKRLRAVQSLYSTSMGTQRSGLRLRPLASDSGERAWLLMGRTSSSLGTPGWAYAVPYSRAGITPSCCIKPSMSIWTQFSTALAFATRQMSRVCILTCFPVGAMP